MFSAETAKDLIRKLLTTDPDKRLSADEALKHDWFKDVSVANNELSGTVAHFRQQAEKRASQVRGVAQAERLFDRVRRHETWRRPTAFFRFVPCSQLNPHAFAGEGGDEESVRKKLEEWSIENRKALADE